MDEFEDVWLAENTRDAAFVKQLAHIAARGRAEFGLDNAIAFLRPADEGPERWVSTYPNGGDDGSEDADRSHGEDEIVQKVRALAQVLPGHGLSEKGEKRAYVCG